MRVFLFKVVHYMYRNTGSGALVHKLIDLFYNK